MGASSPLELARSAVNLVASPVRWAGTAVCVPFQGLGNVFANLTSDQATLSELREQNEELQSRNAELEESQQTAQRLQALLDLRDAYNLQSTGARIISGSNDSWSSTVTIDKGTASGLTAGMPVMSTGGVIGQIVQCDATTSVVRLLTDESSSISAMVQESRAQGMLDGSATGRLSLSMIATQQTVEVGDTVVTSGLGGTFPKGLPLGKVTSCENNPGSLYLTIGVEAFAHTENFEEVLVITSLSEGQEATAEDIQSADDQESAAAANSQAGTSASGDSSDSSGDNASDGGSSSASGDASGSADGQGGE